LPSDSFPFLDDSHFSSRFLFLLLMCWPVSFLPLPLLSFSYLNRVLCCSPGLSRLLYYPLDGVLQGKGAAMEPQQEVRGGFALPLPFPFRERVCKTKLSLKELFLLSTPNRRRGGYWSWMAAPFPCRTPSRGLLLLLGALFLLSCKGQEP
jgi:hypothetical protein